MKRICATGERYTKGTLGAPSALKYSRGMTISAVLVPNGVDLTRHHAIAEGPITAGAGDGEIPLAAANQLMELPLPFVPYVVNYTGFADQLYIFAKSLDGNVTDVRLDATPVTINPNNSLAAATLRLRVDATALPAQVSIWIETHHSSGV